ncbi:MAG: tetratricopeptide repeat protein [Phycisphaerales bacterium]|nr:MAG: tetratricopeptide repeat protein [Phycisphaerales bacterium]
MKRQRKPQDKELERRPRSRLPLWIRLLVALLSPVIFLVVLEVVLRIAGYGQPDGFFIRADALGQTVYLANHHYCEHFVPKELSRAPESIALGDKAASTVRVFVLGGSAVFGDPDPAYGFCRQLEVLLNAHCETVSFEVVNAAVTAMNSHVARRIARDCAALEPDAFLVYMGNNEVVGPYGPSTLPASLYASRTLIDLSIAAKKESRLGQLMNNSIQALRASGTAQRKWMGMEAFLDSQIARDDERMKSCYDHFRDNLNDVVATARAGGAAAVLCTVPTNLRSCPPFGSQHRNGLTEAQLAEWERLFAEGQASERAGDFSTALVRYEQAGEIDALHAALAFRTAKCLHALDRPDEAKHALVKARDLDTLRFRADSPINRIIREVAQGGAEQGVILCDLEGYLEARSPDRLLGDDLLADHVHLNFRGNFLAAMAALEAIARALPAAGLRAPTASRDELFSLCRNRLLYDDGEAYRLGMVMYRRKTLPPFAGQIDHDSELSRLRVTLLTVYAHLRGRQQPEGWYLAAVEQAPFDPYVNVRYGEYLLAQGRVNDAVRGYQRVLAARPFSRPVRVGLAQALAAGGMKDQAVKVLTGAPGPHTVTRLEALMTLGTYYVTNHRIAEARAVYQELGELAPDDADVLVNLAAGALNAGDLEQAKQHLDRALGVAPNSAQAMINMGNYYAKQNEPQIARQWFADALTVEPYDYLAHVGLGIQSIRLKEIGKGLEHIKKAVVLKPDFALGYRLLAETYQQLGRAERARQYGELCDLFGPDQSAERPPTDQL